MDNILGMLGLARRARKAVSGAEIAEAAVKNGKARLVIVAKDTTDTGKKAITDACEYYGVKYIEYGTKEQLGKIMGAHVRTVVSINDAGFAGAVLKKYAEAYDRKE